MPKTDCQHVTQTAPPMCPRGILSVPTTHATEILLLSWIPSYRLDKSIRYSLYPLHGYEVRHSLGIGPPPRPIPTDSKSTPRYRQRMNIPRNIPPPVCSRRINDIWIPLSWLLVIQGYLGLFSHLFRLSIAT